jgi:ribosome-associated protein
VEIAREKKAVDIMTMDLSGITLICDHFLLMTAANTRQAQALSDYLAQGLKETGNPPLRIEGYKEGRWILLDFGSVVVHIFQEEERRYYNLERLWGDAKIQAIT